MAGLAPGLNRPPMSKYNLAGYSKSQASPLELMPAMKPLEQFKDSIRILLLKTDPVVMNDESPTFDDRGDGIHRA